eukprot:12004366-Prorocentrum_lima.AAC.1
MSMSLSSKSLMRSSLALSNISDKLSLFSAARMVITSSLPAQRRILPRLAMLRPSWTLRSQRKRSKPSERSSNATNDTWEESIACRLKPLGEHS